MGLPDLIDLAVLALLILAALHGWHRRGSRLAGHWTGLLVGAAVGTALAARWATSWPGHRVLVVVGLVLGGLLLGGAIGARIGYLAAAGLRRIGLAGLDRLAGAVASTAVVALCCALALGALAGSDVGRWSHAAAQSSAVQADRRLGHNPDGLARDVADRTGLRTLPALLGRPAGTTR